MLNNVCILDFETTGLDASNEEIIEVGALFFKKGQWISSSQFLVKGEKKISAFITSLTGITQEERAAKGLSQNSLKEFFLDLKDHVIIAHNSHFEKSFLHKIAKDFDLLNEFKSLLFADTLSFFALSYPSFPSFSLEYLIQYFHLKTKESHRAFEDAKDLFQVLRLSKNKKIFNEEELLWGDIHLIVSFLKTIPDSFHFLKSSSSKIKKIFLSQESFDKAFTNQEEREYFSPFLKSLNRDIGFISSLPFHFLDQWTLEFFLKKLQTYFFENNILFIVPSEEIKKNFLFPFQKFPYFCLEKIEQEKKSFKNYFYYLLLKSLFTHTGKIPLFFLTQLQDEKKSSYFYATKEDCKGHECIFAKECAFFNSMGQRIEKRENTMGIITYDDFFSYFKNLALVQKISFIFFNPEEWMNEQKNSYSNFHYDLTLNEQKALMEKFKLEKSLYSQSFYIDENISKEILPLPLQPFEEFWGIYYPDGLLRLKKKIHNWPSFWKFYLEDFFQQTQTVPRMINFYAQEMPCFLIDLFEQYNQKNYFIAPVISFFVSNYSLKRPILDTNAPSYTKIKESLVYLGHYYEKALNKNEKAIFLFSSEKRKQAFQHFRPSTSSDIIFLEIKEFLQQPISCIEKVSWCLWDKPFDLFPKSKEFSSQHQKDFFTQIGHLKLLYLSFQYAEDVIILQGY